jgi:nitrite reductase (NADH) small subunit
MSPLLRVATLGELPPEGGLKEFVLENGRAICIANHQGSYTALAAECPHVGAPLAQGDIEDGKLVCPWHGWEFRLSDGLCANRVGESVQCFELVIEGDEIFVQHLNVLP